MRINTATTVAKLLIGLMTLFYVAYATAITIPSNRNPKYNSSINPKYNSSINPKYNSSINPKYNSSVNPKQASSADLLSKVRGSSCPYAEKPRTYRTGPRYSCPASVWFSVLIC